MLGRLLKRKLISCCHHECDYIRSADAKQLDDGVANTLVSLDLISDAHASVPGFKLSGRFVYPRALMDYSMPPAAMLRYLRSRRIFQAVRSAPDIFGKLDGCGSRWLRIV